MKRSFRRLASTLLALALLCALCIPACAANVSVSNMKVEVNGYYQGIEAYLIDGNNYFKLRDIAALMDPMFQCTFDISFSPEARTVDITTGNWYAPVGGELSRGGKANPQVLKSDWILNVNGKRVNCSAYLIDGSNYYKLRDLGDALGFAVGYDSATRTVQITAPTEEDDELGFLQAADKKEYDSNGRLVKETERYLDGTTYLYDNYTTYTYDASGKLMKSNYCLKDGSSMSETRYTYDASGKLTSTMLYYGDTPSGNEDLYTYNAKGQLTKLVSKDSDGAIWSTETYSYDASGNLAKKVVTYDFDPSSSSLETLYLYENGRLVRSEEYYEDYMINYNLYDYDANGNLLGISARTPEGTAYYPLIFVNFGG